MTMNATDFVNYVHGARGEITLQSNVTGAHYTYRFRRAKDDGRGVALPIFVSLLTGSDNESSYRYLATIFGNNKLVWTKKSCLPIDAPASKALDWTWWRALEDSLPDTVTVLHNGTCGHCGRKLTTPESIVSGIGPVCAQKVDS